MIFFKIPLSASCKYLSLFLRVKVDRLLQTEFGRRIFFLKFQGIPDYEMNWQISYVLTFNFYILFNFYYF